MLDFFNKIFEYIAIAFDFLFSIIRGLLQFLKFIPNMFTFINTMSAYVPAFLLAFFMVGFSMAVVLKIIGR